MSNGVSSDSKDGFGQIRDKTCKPSLIFLMVQIIAQSILRNDTSVGQ